jgi:hypothetical protein
MADDNVTKFPSTTMVSLPGEPDARVIRLLEVALEKAKAGVIDFAAVVAIPSDGSPPVVAAAGVADPYRVIGALMHGTFAHLSDTDATSTKKPV